MRSCWACFAGGTTGLQKLVSFAGEVEGLSLRLAVLEVHHPLLSQQALMQLLQWHYIRAARPQLYKLVGSANVIGGYTHALHMLVTVGCCRAQHLRAVDERRHLLSMSVAVRCCRE